MRYAYAFVVILALVCVSYFVGYRIGTSDTRVEYVVKEKEVIKYVDKKKSDIYSRPNASRSTLLRLFHSGKL